MNAKPLWETKTFWTAVVALVTAVGMCVVGDSEWSEVLPLIFGAIGGITMRQGLPK